MDKPSYIHPDYKKAAHQWQRCRDVVAGQDAVHAAGVHYLPKLSEQSQNEYEAYKTRTPFYPATNRTLSGLVGMVFRKEPHVEVPAAMQPYVDDVTLSGVSVHGLARHVLSETAEVGRCGLLVEFPRVQQQPNNLAAAVEMNLRPYASMYKAESIINWRVQRVNNQMMPVLVVLHELNEIALEFETKTQEQLRVLTLRNGYYEQLIYRRPENGQDYVLIEEFTPLMNGNVIPYIPFYAFGPDELSLSIQQPPILDLADLNLSHYRTNADLEHGAHFTGLPMLFISGLQLEENVKVGLGSTTAIVAPNPDAKANFVEFQGQGLGALEKLIDRKEAQMAAIGARMLAPEKSGVEAAETLAMRQNGETSVLASLANLVSEGIERMLNTMREWAGISGECVYQLSTDFLPVRMGAQELTALVQTWQAGGISKSTLFYNLQAGEIIQPGKTLEEEQSDIDMEGPALGTVTDNADADQQ